MIHYNYDSDKYAEYEAIYDPEVREAQRRRSRRRRKPHHPEPHHPEPFDQLTDDVGLENNFKVTYQPARYEEEWLISSLYPFYDQELISDVLRQVKGGKEANVYCCAAHPTTGQRLVAAKVYRPRKFRNLRNDKLYREGRALLTAEGRAVKKNDHRTMRAVGKKSDFGVQVQHTSWLMHEFTIMQRLYEAGAAVPQPLAAGENAILMAYLGDARQAAPTLQEIRLAPEEAERLFQEVLRNIELMLELGLVHGDLSAYNLLYWEGAVTLIDFPQITSCHTNSNAAAIFERDLRRVCDYFRRQGVPVDTEVLLARLWGRYERMERANQAADLSRFLEE